MEKESQQHVRYCFGSNQTKGVWGLFEMNAKSSHAADIWLERDPPPAVLLAINKIPNDGLEPLWKSFFTICCRESPVPSSVLQFTPFFRRALANFSPGFDFDFDSLALWLCFHFNARHRRPVARVAVPLRVAKAEAEIAGQLTSSGNNWRVPNPHVPLCPHKVKVSRRIGSSQSFDCLMSRLHCL